MSAAADKPIPECGDLRDRPLPQLLLDLYRLRFSGEIALSRERVEKRVRLREGAPVACDSNLESERLGVQLVETGALSSADAARIAGYVEQKGCQEGSAILALQLLPPKELFVALKAQVRRRILACFGWPDGAYVLVEGGGDEEDVQAFRCDPFSLVQDGLSANWSPERMLSALSTQLDRFPHRTPALETALARLHRDDATQRMFEAIDGKRDTTQVVGMGMNSPTALAALWVAHSARLLDYRLSADADAGDSLEAKLGGEFEIEVEIQGKSHAGTSDGPTRVVLPKKRAGNSEQKTNAMRSEIEEKSDRLDNVDFYRVLGVPADAAAAQIKKAYFTAAKRYHPDALARMGLDDLKEKAGAVFGRIAEAYETLSNAAKRKDYDLSLQGDGPEIDTARLAQAETFFRKGEILIRMGDFRGSLEYLQPAVDLWPDESAYQSALGWAQFKQSPSDLESALEHLERALELAPNDAVANFRLGMALRSAGETERAEALLELAKKLEA